MAAGMYHERRTRAAYWDGKNETGEAVASGIYFYTFKAADDFTDNPEDVNPEIVSNDHRIAGTPCVLSTTSLSVPVRRGVPPRLFNC